MSLRKLPNSSFIVLILSIWLSEDYLDAVRNDTFIYIIHKIKLLVSIINNPKEISKYNPASRPLSGLGRMDGHTHFGSLFVIGEQATASFCSALTEAVQLEEQAGKIGLSELIVPGFAVRMLADSTQTIERLFGRIVNYTREQWFGKAPVSLRKY